MSNTQNDMLLERAAEAIDMAAEHIEFWVGTLHAKILDAKVAQVTKHIEDNNLDDLYRFSLPALEDSLLDSTKEIAEQSQEHYAAYDILTDRDVY